MKNILFRFSASVCVALALTPPGVPANAQAQQPTSALSTSNQAPKTKTKEDKIDPVEEALPDDNFSQLLLWELELAVGGYRLTPTPDRYSRILTALEKLIFRTCMQAVHRTLSYRPATRSEACQGFIEETLRLHPENRAALCARDGFRSPGCQKAWDTLIQKSFSEGFTGTTGTGVDAILNENKARRAAAPLKKKLQSLSRLPLRRPNPFADDKTFAAYNKRRDEAISVLTRLIPLICKRKEYKVVKKQREKQQETALSFLEDKSTPTPSPRIYATPAPVNMGVEKGRRDLSTDDEQERLVPPPPYQISRVRMVSEDCRKAIARGRKLEPSFPGLTCAAVGDYSPQCIRALQEWRQKRSEARNQDDGDDEDRAQDQNRGFEEF